MSTIVRTHRSSDAVPSAIGRLITSLGEDAFSEAMMEAVDTGAPASGCAAFLFRPEGARAVLATDADHGLAAERYACHFWRRDRTLLDKRVATIDPDTTLYHYPTRAVRDPLLVRDCYEVSDTVDQLLLRRRSSSGVLALSIFRKRRAGPFSDDCVEGLAAIAPILLAAVGRHSALASPAAPRSLRAITLDEAEELVAALSSALTRREVQVCARVLRGVTSEGIAIDLKISKATVATFRKRAYARLAISGVAELFNLCLAQSGSFARTGEPSGQTA